MILYLKFKWIKYLRKILFKVIQMEPWTYQLLLKLSIKVNKNKVNHVLTFEKSKHWKSQQVITVWLTQIAEFIPWNQSWKTHRRIKYGFYRMSYLVLETLRGTKTLLNWYG